MGKGRKRVAARAAKKGDAAGKGNAAQTHGAPMQAPAPTLDGPEVSGFFDVATLATIAMPTPDSPPPTAPDTPMHILPIDVGDKHAARADGNANGIKCDSDAVAGDVRGGNKATDIQAHGVDSGDDHVAKVDSLNDTDTTKCASVDDGNVINNKGAITQKVPPKDTTSTDSETYSAASINGKPQPSIVQADSKGDGAAPVDSQVAPVHRAYDLFSRLRVWSTASALSERSVIADDPNESGIFTLDKADAPALDGPSKQDGCASNVSVDSVEDVRCAAGDGGAGDQQRSDGSRHSSVDDGVPVEPLATPTSCITAVQCDVAQGGREDTLDGAAPADAPSHVAHQIALSFAADVVSSNVDGDDDNGGESDANNLNVTAESACLQCETETTLTFGGHDGLDAIVGKGSLDDTSTHGDLAESAPANTLAPTDNAMAPATGAVCAQPLNATLSRVDEPGWSHDVVAAIDAHMARAISGKASPRIVVFSHGAAPSALASVQRFGPDAIVWVASSSPSARDLQRHGCSVVRWPARKTAASVQCGPLHDLISAVPWHRVDVVIDVGTGRLPLQRAQTLAALVPLMCRGSVYTCAVDCRQAALDLLQTGAAAIVHEHPHAVIIEPSRAYDARP